MPLRWGKQSILLKIARLASKLLQPILPIHNRTQLMEKRSLGCTINNTTNWQWPTSNQSARFKVRLPQSILPASCHAHTSFGSSRISHNCKTQISTFHQKISTVFQRAIFDFFLSRVWLDSWPTRNREIEQPPENLPTHHTRWMLCEQKTLFHCITVQLLTN